MRSWQTVLLLSPFLQGNERDEGEPPHRLCFRDCLSSHCALGIVILFSANCDVPLHISACAHSYGLPTGIAMFLTPHTTANADLASSVLPRVLAALTPENLWSSVRVLIEWMYVKI